MFRDHLKLKRIGYGALLGYAATAPFSISLSQAFLAVDLLIVSLLWRSIPREIRSAKMSWFYVGAAGYGLFTILSASFSQDPLESLIGCKNLLLLLIPIAALLFLETSGQWWGFLGVFSITTILASLYGIFQYYVLLGAAGISTRAHGFFSIYMTYGQFLMLAGTFAMAVLLARTRPRRRALAAVLWMTSTAAMGLSFVRGAWVGMLAAFGVLLGLKKKRYLIVLPVALLMLVLLAPLSIFSRMMSIFSLHDQSNRDRIDLMQAGLRMVRDNPVLGVGPNMVSRVYLLYKAPGSFPRISPHLHNNLVQIAAERGLIALLFWCLMLASFFHKTWRQLHDDTVTDESAIFITGSFVAVISFLVAGLFDFNFGDSEIVMAFLMTLSIPYGVDRKS